MGKTETLMEYLDNQGVLLVAVSKTKPVEAILGLYNRGHRVFGENRAQELAEKHPQLPDDVEWHMIGHLQTNKVKYIASFVSMIHSCDSLKLLKTINKEALKHKRVIPVLLQIHIAREETKYGLSLEEAEAILAGKEFGAMTNVKVTGLMGMATFTDDMDLVRKEFRTLKQYFDTLKEKYFSRDPDFKELSMGMSGDYKVAVEEGSTIVRIGSLIFGARD